jgi:hypothetical protein
MMRSGGAACDGRPGAVSLAGLDALWMLRLVADMEGRCDDEVVRVPWPLVQVVRPTAANTAAAIVRPRCTGP